jgi:hypothetical protein
LPEDLRQLLRWKTSMLEPDEGIADFHVAVAELKWKITSLDERG